MTFNWGGFDPLSNGPIFPDPLSNGPIFPDPFQRAAHESYRRAREGRFNQPPPGAHTTAKDDEPAPVDGRTPKHGTPTARAATQRRISGPHDLALLHLELIEKLKEVADENVLAPDWSTFQMGPEGDEYIATVTCRRPTLTLTNGVWT